MRYQYRFEKLKLNNMMDYIFKNVNIDELKDDKNMDKKHG